MENFFNVKNEVECVSGIAPLISDIFLGDVNDGLDGVCKSFALKKVEFVITESDYNRVGTPIFKKLKSLNEEVKLLLVEDSDIYFSSIKTSLDKSSDIVIAVGDSYLLSTVRYYASLRKIPACAIVTAPNFDKILSDSVWLKTKVFSSKIKAEKFKKIIIDQNLISKSSRQNFAKAFIFSASRLTSLIDYKINCFTNGEEIDGWVFDVAKKAVNFALSAPRYQNFTAPIIASQLLIAIINGKSSAIIESGVDCLKTSLSVFASDLSRSKIQMIAFEKTARIYHMFFSNDFSSLLSVPDYYGDIELLEKELKRSGKIFIENLKIPSERRRTLINLLISQTATDFKAETTMILKAFSKIRKIYDVILGDEKLEEVVSYKKIKNSVVTCSYFSNKTSIFTLARDMGVLKCIN